ncbi:MAG: glutamate--tRNA ligase [Pirellulaceae bacterium]|nr:glutamate--tRNA ligase [Pirellulaceae bacterium]
MTARTRFAPSPTGYLHIGGVRTALFNWLFAKQNGGQFILRIDDTDQKRNVETALKPILDGFRWLGMDWDEGPEVGGPYGPYYQSERSKRYEEGVATLLEKGLAYYDYAHPEELQAERQAAEKEKRPFLYSRRFMADTDEKKEAFEAEGRKAVVRLKMPREGNCSFVDLVRGEVSFEWAQEQDHVIQRNDGTCLYHLATVIDDHDFKITHVIRAVEHLSNTPRQIFIAQGLGYDIPEYAHLPYVAEPNGKNKLSKRKIPHYLKNREFKKVYDHGVTIANRLGFAEDAETFNPVLVDFYEKTGYLPSAILNYLALLGWSLDGETEDFSVDDLIKHFTLERVTKAPAGFDPQKLWAFQDRFMQRLSTADKVFAMLPFLINSGLLSKEDAELETEKERLGQIIEACGDRLKVMGDLLEYADFFYVSNANLVYNEKDFKKRLLKENADLLLEKLISRIDSIESFDTKSIENSLRTFLEEEGLKMGEIVHPLRIGTTGKGVGPGIFDSLSILGKEVCLARLQQTLERIRSAMGVRKQP